MIWKIFDKVIDFMSSTYVVVILTIITDVYMAMEDGIYGFSGFIEYTIIIPIALMMFFKGMPYVIASVIGVVVGLIAIIRCIFKLN